MKKILCMSVMVLVLCGFAGLSFAKSPTAVLKQYEGYQAAGASQNKVGFSIKKVGAIGDMMTIDLFFTNPEINQNENNNGVVLGRIQIFNAENIQKPVTFQRASGTSTTTKPDGTKTLDNYVSSIWLTKPEARYVIVYFEGIPQSEAPDLATPAMFYIVDLNKKEPRALTEEPKLAGNLLD